MAVSTSCCLNLSPPTPGSTPSPLAPAPSKPNQISWQRKEGSWRSQCFVGMACIVIGCGPLLLGGDQCGAFAEDLKVTTVESERKVARWSDRRTCPPWHMNSLETIVPENLPRPYSHRKSEEITLSRITPSQPTVKVTVKMNGGCFSL